MSRGEISLQQVPRKGALVHSNTPYFASNLEMDKQIELTNVENPGSVSLFWGPMLT